MMEAKIGQPGKYLLDRIIHRACTNCQAPGVFASHESIRIGWPKCHVAEDDALKGISVGDVCPCCGAERPKPETLPTIEVEGVR
jgi:hypothetical protein